MEGSVTEAVKEWDVITLNGLKAVGNHGVYDFERSSTQDFVVDLTLYVDTRSAARSDDLADTVDYSQVAEDAVAVLTGPAVFLIETLASRVAEVALTYPRVLKAQVTIHKPMAPLRHQFSDVAVTVVRERRNVGSTSQVAPEAKEDVRAAGVEKVETPVERFSADRSPVVFRPPSIVKSAPRPPVQGKHGRQEVSPTYRRTPSRPHPHTYDVVLALGANKGKVIENLRGAVAELADLDGFEIVAVSPLIRTEPVLEEGALPQDDYLNAVVVAKSVLAPPALLAATQKIEEKYGRVRSGRWGARTLDIDIIDLDRMILSTKSLTLPHPRASGRAFVLYPWLRADEDAYLPVHGFVRDLLPKASDLGGIIAEYPSWLEREGAETGESIDLHFAPRSPRGRKLHKDAHSPHVVLRGEDVVLADVENDPIFQKLLDKEQRNARLVPRAHAREIPTGQVSPPPRPGLRRPRTEPRDMSARSVENTERVSTEVPQVRASLRRTPVAPVESDHTPPSRALPDWEFSTRAKPVRVVDSIDRTDESNETPLEGVVLQQQRALKHSSTSAMRPANGGGRIPRVARGVTVRPTPTGSVPVSRRQGQISEIQTENR